MLSYDIELALQQEERGGVVGFQLKITKGKNNAKQQQQQPQPPEIKKQNNILPINIKTWTQIQIQPAMMVVTVEATLLLQTLQEQYVCDPEMVRVYCPRIAFTSLYILLFESIVASNGTTSVSRIQIVIFQYIQTCGFYAGFVLYCS